MSKKKPMKKWKKRLLTIILVLFILGGSSGLFILYGPWGGFRDWLITTAMTTLNHQWIAKLVYSDETIAKVMADNAVIESGEDTNTDEVELVAHKQEEKYANEYEEAILKKDEGNDLYKVINVSGKGYQGFLVAIYDPSRIHIATTSKLGVTGESILTVSERENAIIAMNAGPQLVSIVLISNSGFSDFRSSVPSSK